MLSVKTAHKDENGFVTFIIFFEDTTTGKKNILGRTTPKEDMAEKPPVYSPGETPIILGAKDVTLGTCHESGGKTTCDLNNRHEKVKAYIKCENNYSPVIKRTKEETQLYCIRNN